MKNLIQEIIDKYKLYIESKGWSHAQAAEKIGCCRAHMSRIFNGERTPSIKLLMEMEKVINGETGKEIIS